MRLSWLGAACCAALIAGPAPAQDEDSTRQAVETGLRPAVVFDGSPVSWTLEERMARWNVPGVSIAVVEDGQIAWAQGYGVVRAGEPAPITPETRFQAASISKPVAAAAALSLVADGRLSLDRDVNADLRRWTIPATPFTQDRPLTLRDLLSHTGGTTVHGFPGYARGEPVPTAVQVLQGALPANTAGVISEATPGERWKYSGGGYQIVQVLMEDVTGEPFADIVQARVLEPAGMTHSGYVAPAPGAFAAGHGSDGAPVEGDWHIYPEQAAAGLWTTPTDLARFGLALGAAYRGESDDLLPTEVARMMMTPVMGGYGLGPGVSGEGADLAISHGGANEGFRAFWIMHPLRRDGVVVMTNGDGGDQLAMEIIRGLAVVRGWTSRLPAEASRFAIDPTVLDGRAGTWVTDFNGQRIIFTLTREDDELMVATPRGDVLFTPTSPTTMISAETGVTATFDVDESGAPTLSVFGLTLTPADSDTPD